jgi:hypothetical protein
MRLGRYRMPCSYPMVAGFSAVSNVGTLPALLWCHPQVTLRATFIADRWSLNFLRSRFVLLAEPASRPSHFGARGVGQIDTEQATQIAHPL